MKRGLSVFGSAEGDEGNGGVTGLVPPIKQYRLQPSNNHTDDSINEFDVYLDNKSLPTLPQQQQQQQSKYIANLVQRAKQRSTEQALLHQKRLLQKNQSANDSTTEQYITAAYKYKLADQLNYHDTTTEQPKSINHNISYKQHHHHHSNHIAHDDKHRDDRYHDKYQDGRHNTDVHKHKQGEPQNNSSQSKNQSTPAIPKLDLSRQSTLADVEAARQRYFMRLEQRKKQM